MQPQSALRPAPMAPAQQATCYYDGACALCRRSIAILKALDWLDRTRPVDFTRLPDDQLPVSRREALESVILTTPRGRILRGFDVVRHTLLRTPLGALPALFLYLPGVSHAGRAAYKRISANRHREAAHITCH